MNNMSIIIPSLGHENLEKCLYFLNKYSYHKNEVLVHLNNCSTEKYEEIKNWKFDNFDNYHVQYSKHNIGIPIPVNSLVKKSKFDFMLYLNDDEFVFRNFDKNLFEFANKYNNVDNKMFTVRRIESLKSNANNILFSGLSIDISEEDLEQELDNEEKYINLSLNTPIPRKSVVPNFMNKEVFLELGGYDERLYPMGGTDSFLGYEFIRKYGIENLILVPTVLVFHNSERRGTENNTIPLIRRKVDEYSMFQRKFGIPMAQYDNMLWDFSKINDKLSSEYIVELAFKFFNVVQNKEELLWLVDTVRNELKPKNVLEIGVERGGTSFIWNLISGVGKKIGVNYTDEPATIHRNNTFKVMGINNIKFIDGNSHDKGTYDKVLEELVGQKVDFLFLDGDHSYEGVKQDFEMYSPVVRDGGFVGFHDVIESDEHKSTNTLVYKFWQELPIQNRREKIVGGKDIFGIGLYQK